jgi:hypothetical protein
MSARSWLLALVVGPLLALAAHAQSYTIQIKAHPAEGKSFTATETSVMNIKFSLAQDNKSHRDVRRRTLEAASAAPYIEET